MPAKRRKNGEGSWGTKKIKGVEYKYFRKQYNDTDKYFYGKTEKEIKEKIKAYENDNSLTIDKDIKKQIFGDYLLNWLKTIKQPAIKRRTYDSYEDIVNVQIINYTGFDISGKQIGSLNDDVFQKYYNDLASQYSRATIRKNYVIVKQCLEYALIKKHVTENFLENVTIPSEDLVKVKKKEINFLTESDMDKLYNESKRVNTKGFNIGGKVGEPVYGINAYAVIFIMYTGLRIGELIALKWKDVDLDGKYIYINKSASTIKNRDKNSNEDKKYVKEITSAKTKSGNRSIPLSDRAIEMLNLLINKNPNYKPDDIVFLNQNDNMVSRANVTRTLQSMLTRAECEVEQCGLHALRHTFGSYLILHKIDVKIVSQLMGHKDVTVTYNIYVHIIEQQKIDAVNIFDKIKQDEYKKEEIL